MWPHYRKVVGFIVSLINPDPEFDILDFRQYNKIFSMVGLWKKVICIIYIVIIWSKHLVKEIWKIASVATSWDMWPHNRKSVGSTVSLINQDYF